uniref:Retrotransposon gag domain-containing protein n=1 Tax=Cajanus cajan TaxID=3821 RepID=A0A151UHQ4_CAJCA
MSKKGDESFKTYEQRWREMVAQVEPSLFDKKMVTMFINSLSGPYYDKMIGNTSTLFADIVTIAKESSKV